MTARRRTAARRVHAPGDRLQAFRHHRDRLLEAVLVVRLVAAVPEGRQDFEFFGIAEQAKGRTAAELVDRKWTQYAGEGVFRFLADERAYVAARYNTANGRLNGMTNDVGVNRYQFGGGMFITPNVLMKGEWVNQKYNDFPTTDIRSGGKFRGFMVEGVVAF